MEPAQQTQRIGLRKKLLSLFPDDMEAGIYYAPTKLEGIEFDKRIKNSIQWSANYQIVDCDNKQQVHSAFEYLSQFHVIGLLVASPYIAISVDVRCYLFHESWMENNIMHAFLTNNLHRNIVHDGDEFLKHYKRNLPFLDTLKMFTGVMELEPRQYALKECLEKYRKLPEALYEVNWPLEQGVGMESDLRLRSQYCNVMFLLFEELVRDYGLHGCLLKEY